VITTTNENKFVCKNSNPTLIKDMSLCLYTKVYFSYRSDMPDVDTMWFVRRMQFMNITGAAIASCL
jgi:hypothetical protein